MTRTLLILAVAITATSAFATEKTKSELFCLGVSPDGKSLALGMITEKAEPRDSWHAGSLNLKSRQLTFFEMPAKSYGPISPRQAAWSPDSRSLVFALMMPLPEGPLKPTLARLEAGQPVDMTSPFQLWHASVKTGRTRKLSMGDRCWWQYVRFSPDGKQLLAYDGSSRNVALVDVNSGWYDFILSATRWKKANV